jgi:hypothetical protein
VALSPQGANINDFAANIKASLVYETKATFPATAGIADFNPSIATNISTFMSMFVLMQLGRLLSDPAQSAPLNPLRDGQGRCRHIFDPTKWTPCEETFFLPGGAGFVAPLDNTILDFLDKFPEATAYVVPKTKGYHLESGDITDLERFKTDATCTTYGDDSGATEVCLSSGADKVIKLGKLQTSFHVSPPACLTISEGSTLCPFDLMFSNNISWKSSPDLSTSLAVYRRTATVAYSSAILSILFIEDLSSPTRISVPIPGLFSIFNPLFYSTTAPQPGIPSTLAQFMALGLPINDSGIPVKYAIRCLRNFLILPLHYWQASFQPPERFSNLQNSSYALPEDMHTTVSMAVPSYHIAPGKGSFWIFAGFSGAVLLSCLGVFLYASTKTVRRPHRTGYATVDFAINCLEYRGKRVAGAHDGEFEEAG